MNYIIERALRSADVPEIIRAGWFGKERRQRVDGTLTPWSSNSSLIGTQPAPSNLTSNATLAGKAADDKALRRKRNTRPSSTTFVPVSWDKLNA